MSEITFSGPVEVSPELAMAMWKSMPEVGRSGVAQLFFSRFVTAPISDAALVAGAKVFFEKNQIGTAAANALREGVAAKCREYGEKLTATPQVMDIVNDETRKASAEFARGKVNELLAMIPLEALIEAVTPAVLEVARACAHFYFTKNQKGQSWLLGMIEKVCDGEQEAIAVTILEALGEAAGPPVNGKVAALKRTKAAERLTG